MANKYSFLLNSNNKLLSSIYGSTVCFDTKSNVRVPPIKCFQFIFFPCNNSICLLVNSVLLFLTTSNGRQHLPDVVEIFIILSITYQEMEVYILIKAFLRYNFNISHKYLGYSWIPINFSFKNTFV